MDKYCTYKAVCLNIFVLILAPSRKRYASEQELELVHFLFTEQGYNPLIRPVANESETIRVDLGLCMIQIIQVVSNYCVKAPLAINSMSYLKENYMTK